MFSPRTVVLLLAVAATHKADCLSVATSVVIQNCERAIQHLELDGDATDRALGYVSELLTYNSRTNVYSQSAYNKLPFHLADSLTLGLRIRERVSRGTLDLGSGSGLPSLLIACVNPDVPVFAVESKSRKTRFLAHAARKLGLVSYTPLTQNVNELSRSWSFEVDFVTAKAFKPLPEVVPIARKCLATDAQLLVPISEAQVSEFSLTADELVREGDFVYYAEELSPSHGTAQRKLITPDAARQSRL
jgi:16S rRNA G527 N7-methylase RsmG